MGLESIAISYLEQDPVFNMDMLESLRHAEADILQADGNGVLLRHHYRGLLFLSVSDMPAARMILSTIDNAEIIVARPGFCLEPARDILGMDHSVECIQHAYLLQEPLALPAIEARVEPLTPQHLQFVVDHYSLQPDKEYILERLCSRAIYGIYYRGIPAGFAGLHAEGALGMLEILPEYRQLGLGYYLQVYMTNLALAQGRIPYSQVKTANKVSLRLQNRCGFTAANQPIYWLWRSGE